VADRDPPLVQLVMAMMPGGSDPHKPRPLPAGLTLRSARPEHDLPVIAELYNAAFGRTGEEAITAERVARIARHPGLRPDGVFLAFEGGLAVGLGVGRLAMRTRGRPERRAGVELLAVRPGYRGRGLAHMLLHAILAWLAGQGVGYVEASTAHPAVVHLLRRHGFAELSPDALQDAGAYPAS